ncbi:MAG: dUTP diphosphatase [Gemmatimonadaceae bacterium]
MSASDARGRAPRERALDEVCAVVFEPLYDDVVVPTRATEQSAGYDLRAYLGGRPTLLAGTGGVTERAASRDGAGAMYVEVGAGQRAIVPLGFRARLPDGHEAQLRMRSSIAFRKGLTMPNAPGTIDADYPDEWLVMLRNDGDQPVRIDHGERIAQVVIARYTTATWTRGAVAMTTTRKGGVGSTG